MENHTAHIHCYGHACNNGYSAQERAGRNPISGILSQLTITAHTKVSEGQYRCTICKSIRPYDPKSREVSAQTSDGAWVT